MADTRLGKIGITVKEPWSENISYEVLDMSLFAVENGGDGCSYVALRNNIGVTPGTDPNTWMKSTQAGQSIYDLAVKYHHFVGTEEEFEAEYQAALQAARDAAAGASAVEAQVEAAEALRVAAETSRADAESARQSAEASRASAETARGTAEAARQSAESGRASAETARVTAEQGRASAESDRVSAEAARAAAETDRVSDFSALKTDMQTAIGQTDAATAAAVATNNQIQTAETGRVSAEQGRVSAETARASAESARATAESGRATAETARATAEGQRATAEGQRVTAENARVSAESGRASAESARVTAEANRVSAETARESQASSDHTRAESDHAIVQGYDTRLTNVEGEVSQLGQELDGAPTNVQVITTLNGYGIVSSNGYITDTGRADYSVRTYILELGKTYHVSIPKLTNKHTAAYSFFPESSASSPSSKYSTLPSEVIVGPITNYEFDVLAPSSELLCLVVCYETAYGTPTVTTLVEGLKKQVESLEEDIESLEEDVDHLSESIQEEIDGLTERTSNLENAVQRIITDVDETIYENSGQVAYYENGDTITGWSGVGTYTPAMAESVKINKIIIPPFQKNLANASIKYLIGHRPYAYAGISNPKTDLTVLAEGEITGIETNTFISNYAIPLASVATIPAGNQIVLLLYSTNSGQAYLLGGGNSSTEMQVYNSYDACAFFLVTAGSSAPFEKSWSIASRIGTTAKYAVCNPILKLEIDSEISKAIHQEVPAMLNTLVPPIVDEYLSQKDSINVHLPDKLYAVVGDTLQLFYRGIIEAIDPYAYDIDVRCAKGRAFPRYYKFTPAAGDIGSYDLTINVRDRRGNVVGTATCTLQVVAVPSSPVSVKKVFIFGDSLTAGGQWPCEANRRLTNTNSVDGIIGKGLLNIDFCGRKEATLNDTLTKFFGVGGWSWISYISRGSTQYRVEVTGVSSVSVGAVYSNNGSNFTIDEVNITAGTGNLLLTRSTGGAPSASGTLTKVSGIGDNTIAFSSYTEEPANPLWDENNNKMSFIPYVTEYGSGSIDAVYVLLSWNIQAAWKQYDLNDTTQISQAKTFLRTLHTEYPNVKAKICGIQMPSVNGGLGNNYGADGIYTDRFGLYVCAFSYNKALQDLCNDAEFSGYCEFVGIASQFDSENNMPEQSVKVNVRNSKTETQGTNGVHPAESGYYQIGDAIYRNFVANFCQSE